MLRTIDQLAALKTGKQAGSSSKTTSLTQGSLFSMSGVAETVINQAGSGTI